MVVSYLYDSGPKRLKLTIPCSKQSKHSKLKIMFGPEIVISPV